jgi:hypothetical protein
MGPEDHCRAVTAAAAAWDVQLPDHYAGEVLAVISAKLVSARCAGDLPTIRSGEKFGLN